MFVAIVCFTTSPVRNPFRTFEELSGSVNRFSALRTSRGLLHRSSCAWLALAPACSSYNSAQTKHLSRLRSSHNSMYGVTLRVRTFANKLSYLYPSTSCKESQNRSFLKPLHRRMSYFPSISALQPTKSHRSRSIHTRSHHSRGLLLVHHLVLLGSFEVVFVAPWLQPAAKQDRRLATTFGQFQDFAQSAGIC